MPLHLGWPHLAKLALRLRVIGSQLNHSDSLLLMSGDESISSLIEKLVNIEKLVITDDSNANAASQIPLLDDKFNSIADFFAQFTASAASSNANKFRTALQIDLQNPACNGCVQSPCQWNEASRVVDDQNLRNVGNCIAPLKEMFDFATDISSEIYAQLAHNNSCPSEMIFSTTHMHKRNSELDLAISASTHEISIDQNGKFQRKVKISFYLNEFWLGDYLACLYAVFHEVFVHGWCGIDIGSETSTQSEDFHDGWMDMIAVHILDQVLTGLQPSSSLPIISAHSELFNNRTKEINSFRMDIYRRSRLQNIWNWTSGATAANTFRQIFAKAIGSNKEANQLFLSFSLGLNSSCASDALRHKLITNINCCYTRNNDKSRGKALADKPDVIDYIVDYASTKDAMKLAENIVSI
jgi:hypothetical protein